VSVILDAGALVAIERRDRRFLANLLEAQRRKVPIRTSSAALAQVWRGGARQAGLARQLPAIDQRALDSDAGRQVGALLGAARTSDVVDGHVAFLCNPGDVVFTSDPNDIRHLLDVRAVEVAIERV
jgi:hypothetical protein